MKSSFHIVLLVTVIVLFAAACPGQSRASRYDPAPQQESSARPTTFLDFTLGRINPANKDYGQCISQARIVLVDETVRNGLFWSNVVVLVSLAGLLLIIAHQHRVQSRRERATAELLTQLEHALVRSRTQLNAVFQNNRELASELAVAREWAGRCIPRSSEPAERIVASSASIRATTPKPKPSTITAVKPVTPDVGQSAADHTGTPAMNQMRLFTPDVDLIMKVNSLEQQLAHSQRDNIALRRRIGDSDRRPASGRQRDQQVKEA